ncbi:MAG: alpha-galactosidase [Deltaproteobacteria bacterium]|nr:MAG: alpha-galactosidase [Deltaproteobacteria bacterium]
MKIRTLIVSIILLILFGCNRENQQIGSYESFGQIPTIPFSAEQIEIEGELGTFSVDITSKELAPNLEIVTIKLFANQLAVPPKFNLEWSFPSIDVYQFWNSNIRTDKVTYYVNDVKSRASSQVPLISFINAGDKNRFTFALSDALNKINTNTWLREEDSKFYCNIELFSEPHQPIKEYSIDIRIDKRNIPYYESISESIDWWAAMPNYTPASVPDIARMPMYSTWYSFHQNLDVQEIIKECRIGKKLGLEAVIVDDGWQTLDNKRGYAYTGDWIPERMGDMKAFVDSLHAFDMKILLWYSLPFIGEKAQLFNQFKGKYLHHWESQGTWVLDPRYPEVREHIINTYETALVDWELDGFKLDFLGWFYADEKTDMTARNGRDYASVNEATDRLMTDIMARLKYIRPDIMIEFRQPYIGPLMRKYGNMFRAADCPNMGIVNRVRTTDLRIASGNTAVHSDMFMWHKGDAVESAALQILNILFTVPQLSVKLDSIPKEHFEMAKFWINYWKENREVLLDGTFVPKNPEALYPELRSGKNNKEIIAVYNDQVVKMANSEIGEFDIVNAKSTTEIMIDFEYNFGKTNIFVYDCLGILHNEERINVQKGVIKVVVPPSGLVKFKRN